MTLPDDEREETIRVNHNSGSAHCDTCFVLGRLAEVRAEIARLRALVVEGDQTHVPSFVAGLERRATPKPAIRPCQCLCSPFSGEDNCEKEAGREPRRSEKAPETATYCRKSRYGLRARPGADAMEIASGLYVSATVMPKPAWIEGAAHTLEQHATHAREQAIEDCAREIESAGGASTQFHASRVRALSSSPAPPQ